MPEKKLQELENIQKLLMLLLFKMGASRDEIAGALGVSGARVSQMMRARRIDPAEVNCIVIGDQYK
jgi:DNA-directed RNA polymerase specialized sigma subunit